MPHCTVYTTLNYINNLKHTKDNYPNLLANLKNMRVVEAIVCLVMVIDGNCLCCCRLLLMPFYVL